MTSCSRVIVAACALISMPLLANSMQEPLTIPAGPEPEIVVYGYPDDSRQLSNFISEIGVETGENQLARWHQAICPNVVGMQAEFNDYVRETIRSVAELAGARIAAEGCRYNVIVVMTTEPQLFIANLRSDRQDLFETLSPRDRERIGTGGDDVQLWSRVETRGERGDVMQSGEVSYNVPRTGSGELPWRSIRGAAASRISRSARSELDFRAIVIDLNRLNGQTMQQLSAFAAMLALGEFDVGEPIAPANTILNLFHDSDATPADISDWDIAYLRALYATNGGRSAHSQRSAMIRHVRRQLSRSHED